MQPTTAVAEYSDVTLATLSLTTIALIVVIGLPVALIGGYWLGAIGRRRLTAKGQQVEHHLGETTQGAFLALLGLLLAFTFGNALSISQAMKAAATDEAAAIGTAFLRADYLADPGRAELKTAIFDYAKTRVVPAHQQIDTREKFDDWLEASLIAQARLWPATLEATKDPTPPPIQAFVASAVNDALDAHLYRVATQAVPIAPFSQMVVLIATITAVFLLANRTGMLGRSLTWRTFAFSMLTALVLYMVADIRRGYQGFIRIEQSELFATIFEMEQALQAE